MDPGSSPRVPLAAAFTLALALAGCARRDAPAPPAAAADSAGRARAAAARAVADVPFDALALAPGVRRVALPLGGGDSLVLAHVGPGVLGDWQARVVRADGAAEALERVPGALVAAGTVDLHRDGTRDAAWVLESGGSGMTVKELHLYCASARRPMSVSLTFAHDLTQPVPGELRGDALERAEHVLDAAFLERLERAHGYVTDADLAARPDDPRLGFYFWTRDNTALADGARMRTRLFRGPPPLGSSVMDSLVLGGVVYAAWFKAGVTAYDPAAGRHMVLFHPADPYAWPTRLAAARGVLVIGTRGEGLALVRLSDLALRRLTVPGHETVDSLAVTDSTITVNGTATVAMPRF